MNMMFKGLGVNRARSGQRRTTSAQRAVLTLSGYSTMVPWTADEDTLLAELCEQHTKKDGRVDWSAVWGAATGALAARTQKSLERRWAKRDGREEAAEQRRVPKRAAQLVEEMKRRKPKRAAQLVEEMKRRKPKRAAQLVEEMKRREPKRAAEPYFSEFPAAEVRQQVVESEPAGSPKLDLSAVSITIFSPAQLESMGLSIRAQVP
jgi:hypothetical protein